MGGPVAVAVAAGGVAMVVFAMSTLPMLGRAVRSKDPSYSRGNLVLSNIGNVVFSVYVFHLPPGPIWLLHAYYLVSSALMLCWRIRYAVPARAAGADSGRGRPTRTGARETS